MPSNGGHESTATSQHRVRLESRWDKQPLKVNVFELATKNMGQIQLVPLFPYLDEGSFVPCLALSIGGPDLQDFLFFHHNSQQEHVLCMSSNGCSMATGQTLGPSPTNLDEAHGVTHFLKDPTDPESFFVMLITIRIADAPVEMEGVSLRCRKCATVLLRRDFDVKSGPERELIPEFYALRYYTETFEEFNASEANRTCPKCSEVHPPVPFEQFGHWRYRRNISVADRGIAELVRAGSTLAPLEGVS